MSSLVEVMSLFYKGEHTYEGDLTYTCELADEVKPTFTGELKCEGDHTSQGDCTY